MISIHDVSRRDPPDAESKSLRNGSYINYFSYSWSRIYWLSCCISSQNVGYEVIVLDNLSNGHQEIVEEVLQVKLIVGDMSDCPLLDNIFSSHNIAAVMHFVAYITVGESVTDPAKYYRNNVVGTLTL
jgi:UDP-glucose 4-epimerase